MAALTAAADAAAAEAAAVAAEAAQLEAQAEAEAGGDGVAEGEAAATAAPVAPPFFPGGSSGGGGGDDDASLVSYDSLESTESPDKVHINPAAFMAMRAAKEEEEEERKAEKEAAEAPFRAQAKERDALEGALQRAAQHQGRSGLTPGRPAPKRNHHLDPNDVAGHVAALTDDQIMEIFDRFDLDNSGDLSPFELSKAVTQSSTASRLRSKSWTFCTAWTTAMQKSTIR